MHIQVPRVPDVMNKLMHRIGKNKIRQVEAVNQQSEDDPKNIYKNIHFKTPFLKKQQMNSKIDECYDNGMEDFRLSSFLLF